MAGSSMCCKNHFINPKGIGSFGPGLARFREGLPWVAAFKFHNPERVEYQRFTKQIQPLQGCGFFLFSPRVARGAQPWAESFNPVGIEKPMAPPQTSHVNPRKTSRNPNSFSSAITVSVICNLVRQPRCKLHWIGTVPCQHLCSSSFEISLRAAAGYAFSHE
jgi:hypothetical protein